MLLVGNGASDIAATLLGDINGQQNGLNADTGGDVTVTTGGVDITTVAGEAIRVDAGGAITLDLFAPSIQAGGAALHATATGTEAITIDLRFGDYLAGTDGVQAFANGGGDVVVRSTGVIGTFDNSVRVGNDGIHAESVGGNITVGMVNHISATNIGILALISGGDGNIDITVNGTIDALTGNGVVSENDGTGTTTIAVNDTVSGVIGVDNGDGGATLVNRSTITGTGGIAVNLGGGDDLYDGRGGTVVGQVNGGADNDIFISGAGNETFDGQGGTDAVYYIGAAGPVVVSLADGIATGDGNDTLNSIEDAAGSDFDDTFIGNNVANRFFGRGGDDTYVTQPGGGADIVDGFVAGTDTPERVDLRAFGGFGSLAEVLAVTTQVGADTVIDLGSGDSLTLTNVDMTDLADGDFTFVPGIDHMLWQHDNGAVRTAEDPIETVTGLFEVAGTDDFDGDGDTDILWHHPTDGNVIWEIQESALVAVHSLPTDTGSFEIAATGDVDGDGDGDIIWRGSDGAVVTWEIQDNAFVTNHNLPAVSTSYHIEGAGDFDGDGDDDILWRHDEGGAVIWEMQGSALVTNHNLPSASTTFDVAGIGDFDADGDADILWRHDDGAVVIWELQDNAFVTNHNLPSVDPAWTIEAVDDQDHDGDADIVWRQTGSGEFVTWEIQDSGLAATHSFGAVADAWRIVGTGEFA